MTLLFSVPAGIFAAIYLVEYAKRGNKFVSVVRMTTKRLQGFHLSCLVCSGICF